MHEPYPGEPVPAVNAADLKSVWALCQDLAPLHQGIVGVDSIIEHACSPGADIESCRATCWADGRTRNIVTMQDLTL